MIMNILKSYYYNKFNVQLNLVFFELVDLLF